MKNLFKGLIVPVFVLITALSFYFGFSDSSVDASTYITKVNFTEQGNRLNVESGGILDVSGGFYLGGTQLTSTASELNQVDADSQAADGLTFKKLARMTIDCTATSTTCAESATVDTGVDLPANAYVTRSFVVVNTALGASGAFIVGCGNDRDLMDHTFLGGAPANGIAEGASTGTAATMNYVGSSACSMVATVVTGNVSAGILNFFVEYVVTD